MKLSNTGYCIKNSTADVLCIRLYNWITHYPCVIFVSKSSS